MDDRPSFGRAQYRFVAEWLVFVLLMAAVFHVFVVDALQSLSPVFEGHPANNGRYRLPETAAGWARLAWIGASVLGYLWVRVTFTDLDVRPEEA